MRIAYGSLLKSLLSSLCSLWLWGSTLRRHAAFHIDAQDAGAAELPDRLAVLDHRQVQHDALVVAGQCLGRGPHRERHFLVRRRDLALAVHQLDATRQAGERGPGLPLELL